MYTDYLNQCTFFNSFISNIPIYYITIYHKMQDLIYIFVNFYTFCPYNRKFDSTFPFDLFTDWDNQCTNHLM